MTVLLYNGLLLYDFNVGIKGLTKSLVSWCIIALLAQVSYIIQKD